MDPPATAPLLPLLSGNDAARAARVPRPIAAGILLVAVQESGNGTLRFDVAIAGAVASRLPIRVDTGGVQRSQRTQGVARTECPLLMVSERLEVLIVAREYRPLLVLRLVSSALATAAGNSFATTKPKAEAAAGRSRRRAIRCGVATAAHAEERAQERDAGQADSQGRLEAGEDVCARQRVGYVGEVHCGEVAYAHDGDYDCAGE
jgi:hypothetical protein